MLILLKIILAIFWIVFGVDLLAFSIRVQKSKTLEGKRRKHLPLLLTAMLFAATLWFMC